jgi:hypothetical protein
MNKSDAELFQIVAKLIVQIAPELLSTLKTLIGLNQGIENKLKNIENKLDNLVIREIQSAFKVIEGIRAINSEGMKERHLTDAESNLLRNISLDPKLITGGYYNYFWSGQAYYGLSLIALLRNENEDAARFLLQTFVISPRMARTTYSPKIYQQQFEPYCAGYFEKYNFEIKKVPEYNKQRAALKSQKTKKEWIRYGGAAVGLVAGLLARNAQVAASGVRAGQNLDKEIADLEQQIKAIPSEESIKEVLEMGLDDVCRRKAGEILGGRSNG